MQTQLVVGDLDFAEIDFLSRIVDITDLKNSCREMFVINRGSHREEAPRVQRRVRARVVSALTVNASHGRSLTTGRVFRVFGSFGRTTREGASAECGEKGDRSIIMEVSSEENSGQQMALLIHMGNNMRGYQDWQGCIMIRFCGIFEGFSID